MGKRVAAAAALLAAGVAPACGGKPSCAVAGVPLVVTRGAHRAAVLLHDPHASSAKYVRTTREAAASLVGGNVNAPDVPVYLVVIKGHFGGGRFLRGRLADFLVSVKTGRLLEVGTTNLLPAIDPLGRVHRFRLRRC